jgi:indolepyruvate ferredoxin oxidoreductase
MGQYGNVTDTARPDLSDYDLADRYRRDSGRLFASGVQALARLPIDQLRIDRANGLSTAAFISGYQGSPVGAFGDEIDQAIRIVGDLPIVNNRGVNEELGATAVMGSQLATNLDDCKYDGILGIWYGKAPGLDRASDAIRHGVFAGTSQHGGVVAVIGDDPSAKSSTLPTSSDATMVDLHMPVLFPGDTQEALDLSRHAVALSRTCGIWSGLKIVTQVADGTGTIDVHPDRVIPLLPEIEVDGKLFRPKPNGRLITPYTLDAEREFHEIRTKLAQEYGVLNHLNRVTVSSGDDWMGIVASGHTYHELREALKVLGLGTDSELNAAGIRLIQLLMPVPLDRHDVRRFADGLTDVLVVEEKNPTLELRIRDSLYDVSDRPHVWGKRDDEGHQLLPYHGLLDATAIVPALRHHLGKRIPERLAPEPERRERSDLIPLSVSRAPFYCSGCPHNTSTRNEPGTLVGGGIGCHGMIALMEPERVGDMVGLTCMGNEGTQWIGMAPFVERDHFVQNLGDGTFFHSGSLAIRASIAAGTNITYKLLHNGTVAMTGGQDAAGAVDVPEIATMLMAEGAARIIVTSDEPDRFDGATFPSGAEVWHRDRFDEAQRALADVKGTTVLIHDQGCAAEKRRARSRGLIAKPGFRVVINERICEGCGDCGDKSNCLSVQPIDTPYGRKTAIHQTSCNFDMTCLKGDCPAFATVSVSDQPTATGKRRVPDAPTGFPTPTWLVDPDEFTVRLSGIGGTGVVTVSQVIGTAAMLDGFHVRGLDQTGLSQKAGPVTSDIRMARDQPAESNHALVGGVDCYLAFDLLAGAGESHLAGAGPDRTVVVGSVDHIPTGEMVVHPGEKPFPADHVLRRRLDQSSRAEHNRYVDAGAVTGGLFGNSMSANIFVLGVAVQLGALPISAEQLERAIELNGVAVEQNTAAFRFGRAWVVDPDTVEATAGITAPRIETTDQLIDRLADDLADWGDKADAKRFRKRIDKVRAAETKVADGSTVLTEAAARHLHKLMAYKDEYEVARLALLDESQARYRDVGGPDTNIRYHLHPPALRAVGMDRKIEFDKTGEPAFKVLRKMKRLRGTRLDPFGYAEVRKVERAMIPEFEAALDTLAERLTPANLDEAVAIASLPDQVRGYEDIKLRRAGPYRDELADRLARFTATG